MHQASSIAAFGLIVTFAWSAVAKLRHVGATEAGFVSLGLTHARLFAHLVPAIELTVVFALVLAPAVGGCGALLMLSAYTAVLANASKTRPTARCNCFGAERPVELSVFVRNVLLGVASMVVIAGASWVAPTAGVMALGVASWALGWILVASVRRSANATAVRRDAMHH